MLEAETLKNSLYTIDIWVWSLGGEEALEEGMATHSSILAGKNPMDRRVGWVTAHGVIKSQT